LKLKRTKTLGTKPTSPNTKHDLLNENIKDLEIAVAKKNHSFYMDIQV